MAKGCCANFVKYTMFVFNLLIFLGGVALLAAGTWVILDPSGSANILNAFLGSSSFSSAATVIIICGVVLLVIGFIGCYGAIKENKCLLGVFSALMMLITLVLVVGASLALVYKDTVTSYMKKKMETSLREKYGMEGEGSITEAWDITQKQFKCCGVIGDYKSGTSWLAYKASKWYKMQMTNRTSVMVPKSCCKMDNGNYTDVKKCQGVTPITGSPPTSDNPTADNPYMYTTGCFDMITEIVHANAVVLGAVALGIVLITVLAMVFSMWLCRRLTKGHSYKAAKTNERHA